MQQPYLTQAVQYRIARPTGQLAAVVYFYEKIIGLKKIGSFQNHAGYDGVMLQLPGSNAHLEFTEYGKAGHHPPPGKDNLLVLYFDTPEKYEAALHRMISHGKSPVDPENPYWKGKSQTFEDPDGWRVVLFNGIYTPTN